jgi:hypothetical protein
MMAARGRSGILFAVEGFQEFAERNVNQPLSRCAPAKTCHVAVEPASTLRIIVSPGNCTLSWMRRTHCRASHLAACGHTVLPKIGPVIALRRRTDYQFSPNPTSLAEPRGG